MSTRVIVVGGREVKLTLTGYLFDPKEWGEEVARAMLAERGIESIEEQMDIVRMVREDAMRYGSVPSGRWIYQQAGGYSKLKKLFSSNAPVATVLQCCGFPEPTE